MTGSCRLDGGVACVSTERTSIRYEPMARAEALPRRDSSDRSVRPTPVVVVAEPVELGLQLSERVDAGLVAQPLLQCLLEAFDLAAGLRVKRRRRDRTDSR